MEPEARITCEWGTGAMVEKWVRLPGRNAVCCGNAATRVDLPSDERALKGARRYWARRDAEEALCIELRRKYPSDRYCLSVIPGGVEVARVYKTRPARIIEIVPMPVERKVR